MRKSMFALALCVPACAQVPADHSTAKTPKASYERAPFSKKDSKGKTVACGTVAEWKNGEWRAFVDTMHSQPFETRQEAVAWVKLYCPIEGTQ